MNIKRKDLVEKDLIITFYSCCVQRRVEEGSEKGQWRKMAGRGRSKGDQH